MGAAMDGEDGKWMGLALAEGEAALEEGEVPVGCVFVKGGAVVGRGHNKTNAELDATRHAGAPLAKTSPFSLPHPIPALEQTNARCTKSTRCRLHSARL